MTLNRITQSTNICTSMCPSPKINPYVDIQFQIGSNINSDLTGLNTAHKPHPTDCIQMCGKEMCWHTMTARSLDLTANLKCRDCCHCMICCISLIASSISGFIQYCTSVHIKMLLCYNWPTNPQKIDWLEL